MTARQDSISGNGALSSLQLKQVDESFESLFGYPWGTTFRLPEDPLKWSEEQRLLTRMLGPRTAAAVIGSKGKSKIRPFRKEQQPLSYKRTTSSRATSTAVKDTAAATTQRGGVDQLLKTLAGPAKQTTVAKTSQDWDKFKEQTGLGDKLEEQAESNSAFLKRQDFLSRVDTRQFELEKQERERARSKRGK